MAESRRIQAENKDREISGLVEALNNFKLKRGLILTFDQEDEIKEDGKIIKILPIWIWLLQNN